MSVDCYDYCLWSMGELLLPRHVWFELMGEVDPETQKGNEE